MQGRKKEQATPGERAPSPQSDYFRDSDQDTMLGKKSACEEKILKGSPEAEFKKKKKKKKTQPKQARECKCHQGF